MQPLETFFKELALTPKNWGLYEEALTHRSFVKKASSAYNERLEFLGDRVLGLVMATWLFRQFKEASEGDLAKRHAVLVSSSILLQVAYDIKLHHYLRVSPALQKAASARVESLYVNGVEALIAAIYLDQGLQAAENFIHQYWKKYVQQLQQAPKDPKSHLQEWAQSQGLPQPCYEVVHTTGPAHAPEFTIKVTIGGVEPEMVCASSKREGEREAAKNLLRRILHHS